MEGKHPAFPPPIVSSPDPAPKIRGKGLGTGERFLGYASSAVLFSGKPIRSQLWHGHMTHYPQECNSRA